MGYRPKLIKGLVKDTGYPIDGCTLTLSLWGWDEHSRYHLHNWEDKDDEAVMKTIHQNDTVFCDEPLEDFKKMWELGIYESDGVYCIDLDKVKVLEVLQEESED